MDIIKATRDFERWLAKQIPLVRRDVALKHAHMAESPFAFFRATFYRWLQLWHAHCVDVASAPKVLAVGDLHIENFGTWRDQEGRLIWGVNDLDEAWPGPYTLDLIRLSTSAYLAISGEHLELTKREAAEAIEEGYRDALNDGGQASEAPDRGIGQPRASANSCAVVVEGRVRRAGSEGDSHLRVGLVSRRLGGKSVRPEAGAKRDSRAGSVRAIPRALAGAAAGPRLFAD